VKASSKLTLLLATAATALPMLANAHYIWIERDAKAGNQAARLYFGEVAEVREQSPGRMDDIKGPRAWAVTSNGASELTVKRTQKYFAITGALSSQLVASESGYEVKDWSSSGIGIVKPMYYARHSAWPLKQAIAPSKDLRLDIQPVAGSKDSFVVLFDGKPLPKIKTVIYAPNDWEKEYKTDAEGRISMPLPWKGQYVVEVIYKELTPGEFEGKKFDAFRHRAVLTVVQHSGLSPKGTGGGATGLGLMANVSTAK
jgi:uncharacterized GH25 family protein